MATTTSFIAPRNRKKKKKRKIRRRRMPQPTGMGFGLSSYIDKAIRREVARRLEELREAEVGCDDPGKKRRSKGKGKGRARGKGRGPMGVPSK